MAKKNSLVAAPPYEVQQALARLGANLRKARLRRNLTVAEAAAKIGTGPRAVQDAEKGKPGASAAVLPSSGPTTCWALSGISQIPLPM